MEPIKALILKYLREGLTPEEQAILDEWSASSQANRDLLAEFNDPDRMALSLDKMDRLQEQAVWSRLEARKERSRFTARFRSYGRAAAVILLIVGAGLGIYISRSHSSPGQGKINAYAGQDINPGGNRAILTLANGQQIFLDSAKTGDLTIQDNARVVKTDGGKLTYTSMGNSTGTTLTYNTLTTPRGGQYQLSLPDGTLVWLNAASSITYPTAFTGRDRKVTITGEAYFEVAKDAGKPFSVKAGEMTIDVLGTHFNVNAYEDEPDEKTTLVEGSVKVNFEKAGARLDPGQQARIHRGEDGAYRDPSIEVGKADIEQALAWKNGFVKMTGAGIREVMRQVSRWYNVDIEYQGNLDKAIFTGMVSRQQNLSGLIQVLEATGSVHCIIMDNKIIVKPS